MKNHILLVFFLTFFCPLLAQNITVSTDKKKIFIGEQFHLHVAGNFKKGQTFTWIIIDSIPHFEILEKSKIDTQQNETSTIFSQDFTLTSWDSGKWQIPGFLPRKSKAIPDTIDVSFSPFDPKQPYHDIKDIIEVKKPTESKWYWYFIFLAILIALFLLFFPKENKKDKPGFIPDEGAYKTALKRLKNLKAREVQDNKAFYTELIDIFRDYLQKRKNIQSFSKTTDDLAIQMDQLQLPREKYQELVQTLRLGDLVKFAQFQPMPEENRNAIEVIEQNIMAIENLQ